MLDGYPDLMTKRDLAQVLQVSESTISTWCSRHPERLPPVLKLGAARNSLIRFKADDVRKFLNQEGN